MFYNEVFFFKKEVHIMVCWVKAISNVEGGNKTFGKNTVSNLDFKLSPCSEYIIFCFG